MNPPDYKLLYDSAEFETLEFHDCHVHGIGWEASNQSVSLDIDYILQWVEVDGAYKFWVAPAELCFSFASEVQVALDWTHLPIVGQIQELRRLHSQISPNGTEIWHWNIEFAIPSGTVSLHSAEFTLKIRSSPVLTNLPNLRDG